MPLFCGLWVAARRDDDWGFLGDMMGFQRRWCVLHTHNGKDRWHGVRGRWSGAGAFAGIPGHGVLTLQLWYDGWRSVCGWHGNHLCHRCGWSGFLASLHPPATTSHVKGARAGGRDVDLIGGFFLLRLLNALEVLLFPCQDEGHGVLLPLEHPLGGPGSYGEVIADQREQAS